MTSAEQAKRLAILQPIRMVLRQSLLLSEQADCELVRLNPLYCGSLHRMFHVDLGLGSRDGTITRKGCQNGLPYAPLRADRGSRALAHGLVSLLEAGHASFSAVFAVECLGIRRRGPLMRECSNGKTAWEMMVLKLVVPR